MNKSIVALAVMGAIAGSASAQSSSVTLFGVVDMATRYTKALGTNKSELASDGSSSSRLGVRGTEDLGGGLKAGFWLEGQIIGDTGSADTTRFWGRRATVSLSGDFGEVRLGRAKTAERLVLDDFDVFSTTGLGDVTRVYRVLGGADNYNRSDNQVSYFTPGNLGGFYGTVDVGAGEGTGGKKYFGGRAGYKEGKLHVAVGYQSTDSTTTGKVKLGSIGATYDFGMVKVNALVSSNKFGTTKQTLTTIGATVPVTANSSVMAQFTNASANTTANEAKMYTVSYLYNLSKRTALYTTASMTDNEAGANFRVTSGTSGVQPSATANGFKYGGFDVGLKHSF
jgi:predicted porin